MSITCFHFGLHYSSCYITEFHQHFTFFVATSTQFSICFSINKINLLNIIKSCFFFFFFFLLFQEENKDIALGTSKLNYLDPRITVAWCRKHEVPLEKVYNRTQRDKFAWAIDMADETFSF